jgi:ribonuclease HI
MKYYTDGFTLLKNPSPVGGGYTIFDENNTKILVENILKQGLTNNEAELQGVAACAALAKNKDIISTDSMNTIAWLRTKKTKKIARQDLLPIIIKAQKLIEKKKINIIWEGRDHNLAGIYNEEQGIDTGVPGLATA